MTISNAEREWLISYHEVTKKELISIRDYYDDLIKNLDGEISRLKSKQGGQMSFDVSKTNSKMFVSPEPTSGTSHKSIGVKS